MRVLIMAYSTSVHHIGDIGAKVLAFDLKQNDTLTWLRYGPDSFQYTVYPDHIYCKNIQQIKKPHHYI